MGTEIIADVISDIIKGHYQYISDCERNHTEMEKDIAILKAKTYELQAKRELAEQYFQYQMQERKRLFHSANQVLEKAIEKGDVEYAQIATKTIEIIHQKSPFSNE